MFIVMTAYTSKQSVRGVAVAFKGQRIYEQGLGLVYTNESFSLLTTSRG
jgi:hypothetical protein